MFAHSLWLQSGAIGQLKSLEAKVLIPSYLFNKNDIRFKASLAGEGCLSGSFWERWVGYLLWSSTPILSPCEHCQACLLTRHWSTQPCMYMCWQYYV
jgi:hypothetical protein